MNKKSQVFFDVYSYLFMPMTMTVCRKINIFFLFSFSSIFYPIKLIREEAYAMGFMFGCGTASKVVNFGSISFEFILMKAPKFSIVSLEKR